MVNTGEQAIIFESGTWYVDDEPVEVALFSWQFDDVDEQLPTPIDVGDEILLHVVIERGLEPGESQ